jgi:hypothetical protein
MNEVAAGPRFFFFFPFLLPTNFPLRHLSYPFPQKQVKQLPIHGRDSSSNVFSAQKKSSPHSQARQTSAIDPIFRRRIPCVSKDCEKKAQDTN